MILGIDDILAIGIAVLCIFVIFYWFMAKGIRREGFNKYKLDSGSEMTVPIPAQWIGEWW